MQRYIHSIKSILKLTENQITSESEGYFDTVSAMAINLNLEKPLRLVLQNSPILQIKNLTSLTLSSVGLEISMIIPLLNSMKETNISYVDLSSNNLKDDKSISIGKLLSSTRVLYLNLANNQLSNQSAKDLANVIQLNKNLYSVNISQNKISNDGLYCFISSIHKTAIKEVNINNNFHNIGLFNEITDAIFQASIKNRSLDIQDDFYKKCVKAIAHNRLNYDKKQNIIPKNTTPHSSNQEEKKFLVFFLAPSCSGKSLFRKFLKEKILKEISVKEITTESYKDLPLYENFKEKGIRHPEFENNTLYSECKKKREELISEGIKSRSTILVETQLNDGEIEEINRLSIFSRKHNYHVITLGLFAHPNKLLDNIKKIRKEDSVDVKSILQDLKAFNDFFDRINEYTYKCLIDCNCNMDQGQLPFLVFLDTHLDKLIFNKIALKDYENNKNLEISDFLSNGTQNTYFARQSIKSDDNFSLPMSLIKIASLINTNPFDLASLLFRTLIPKNIVSHAEYYSNRLTGNIRGENPLKPQKMIFIIRHAESEANVLSINELDHHIDDRHINLSRKGYAQVVLLAEHMAHMCKMRNRKAQLYHSPMERCVETTNILLSKIGQVCSEVKSTECLRERSAGYFHGLSKNSRENHSIQNAFLKFQKKGNNFFATLPGGESPYDVELRLKKFVELINQSEEDIIIVTHAITALTLKKMLLGQNEQWYQMQKEQENASVCIISDFPVQLLEENLAKDVCVSFGEKYGFNNELLIQNAGFLSSCLGYFKNLICEDEAKVFLRRYLEDIKNEFCSNSIDDKNVFLANLAAFGLCFLEEITGIELERIKYRRQGFELFGANFFDALYANEINTVIHSDLLENTVLPISLSHQRREMNSDYPEEIFFAAYFSTEPPEIRTSAHIARKGMSEEGEKFDMEQQFIHAEKWLGYMIERYDGKLFDKIIKKLMMSNLTENETITLVYPVGTPGSSDNVLPICFAERIKKEIAKRVSENILLSNKNLSIQTRPIEQITKTARSKLNPFQKAIYRSYYYSSEINGKILIIDDDATTATSISEMIFACRDNPKITIIGCAVAAIIPGCQVLKIQPCVKEALEFTLRKQYEINNDGFGPNDPVQKYNDLLKDFGFVNGIDSLTNMMGVFQIAALYDKNDALKIVEKIWDLSTYKFTEKKFTEICHDFKNDEKIFPILRTIEAEKIRTNEILMLLNKEVNHSDSLCPRKFVLPKQNNTSEKTEIKFQPNNTKEKKLLSMFFQNKKSPQSSLSSVTEALKKDVNSSPGI